MRALYLAVVTPIAFASAWTATSGCGDDSSGGAGGTTSSTTATGAAGMGGGMGGMHQMCTNPAVDCPAPMSECVLAICEAGMCAVDNVPADTPLQMQVPGDCATAVCDGTGTIGTLEDGNDIPDDNLDCTDDACNGLAPVHTFVQIGDPCDDNGGSVCDGAGECVECNGPTDCPPPDLCDEHLCVPPSCLDMLPNGNETDVDCGGPDCGPCADGDSCLVNGDCTNGFCTPGTLVCATPNCMDNFENGSETDLDCGGPTCPDCANGLDCLVDGDCQSGFCHPVNMVCSVPNCMDGVQNQDETGIDCGGAICSANCPAGQGCVVSADCIDDMCHAGTCFATINGCDIDTATNLTGMSGTTVTFASFAYTPPCIKVSQGTVVTFSGAFASHPLVGGYVASMMVFPQGSGPFFPTTNMGVSKNVTVSQTGTFPYYCQFHGSGGMNGAVFVVP
jgi:plastocyanin